MKNLTDEQKNEMAALLIQFALTEVSEDIEYFWKEERTADYKKARKVSNAIDTILDYFK